jgi:hypothetical protein
MSLPESVDFTESVEEKVVGQETYKLEGKV